MTKEDRRLKGVVATTCHNHVGGHWMDEVMQVAAIVATLVTTGPAPAPERPALSGPRVEFAAIRAPGEDKFRHAAAGWAITVFAYSAARAADQNGDDALVIALPVAAVFGVGKEIADQRRGGGFSVGDLLADALGATAAWLVLREVR